MVKEQIQIEILSSNLQMILAAYERKPDPKLQQELPQVLNQAALQVSLLCFLAEAQEIETIGVFQDLPGQLRLRRRQGAIEVGDGFAVPLVQGSLYLMHKDAPAPATTPDMNRPEETASENLQIQDTSITL